MKSDFSGTVDYGFVLLIGLAVIPSDFRTSRGLIFVLAKYGFQPSGVP